MGVIAKLWNHLNREPNMRITKKLSLPPIDFVVETKSASSNSGVCRAKKKAVQTETMNTARISYKTKLMGYSVSHNLMVDLEEDFELQDGYVTMVLVDGVPSITFFDRVQQFIVRKMALIVVVKLLGKKIGFNAFFNKDKDDFDKILMGSPWVIFRHYLTIRPWSSNFFVANTEVENQIVWIKLSSLSEGYYSEMLLRAIRQVCSVGGVCRSQEVFDFQEEGGIDNVAINRGVDFVAKEGNNKVTVDLPRCGRDEFEDESSSGKENKLFRFGVTGKKSMGREVFIVEEDMHLKKPLDIEPTNHDQPTVGILEAMEGIIQAIENSY
ncbi:hypothetical protein GOBAR_AA35107 [Gossypium barbadense]|uniref:Uncharacterized protein n=1 Tax=Gossypium barbadense TaxID=3634 RepID=A0A2P5W3D7_GOSBA|nr:hypothetical protein GOBAR_AA35107 [Gossypium barbadense]